MNLFDFFKRLKFKKEPPLPPIRTVQKPGSVRRERQEREASRESTQPTPEPQPSSINQSVPEMFDTGSLEIAGEVGKSDNPYDTQTWQVNAPQGPRRVDDLKAVNKERKSGEEDNPYDTIITRKGW
jgi:hypothetical protein